MLLALVVLNLVVGLLCSLAAPREWGFLLCVVALIINLFPVLLTLGAIIGMTTGRLDSLASLVVLPGLLIFVEELWFLYLLSRYRRRHPPAG